ncbi:exodeoxyribonuclease V subunit alpha [Glaciecola sp. MH2013]|uniref:exodeoxyribonuclease V subunit alpha n=1 Tax=Glaciecola sp. MH2013 TaxID=2785524 RepID=UPI00189D1A5D|nr:exodeoxyribonuclease V subunit alpha [Glaciecola sp. MH2013]MBF7073032.1 exodeoxyribonuclease V subunit alpha [Glaciecola sp. MH2013]
MFSKMQSSASPYYSSGHCQSVLQGVEAIDYFFALRMVNLLLTSDIKRGDDELDLLFHLFLALSFFQRQGHSCLDLGWLAGQCLWKVGRGDTVKASDMPNEAVDVHQNNEDEDSGGYFFPEKVALSALLIAVSESNEVAGEILMIAGKQSAYSTDKQSKAYLIFDEINHKLFMSRLWCYEQECARFVRRSLESAKEADSTSIDELSMHLSEIWSHLFQFSSEAINWQELAVFNALLSPLSIISGGAGTGKTYTATRVLLSLLHVHSLRGSGEASIMLAAPTGKAAQRLQESIEKELLELRSMIEANPQAASALLPLVNSLDKQKQSVTVHRMIGLGWGNSAPKFNSERQLNCDILLIDEVSMLDVSMMTKILRALPQGTRLLLLGDANQLPSVESGSVLSDLVAGPWQGKKTTVSRRNQFSHAHIKRLISLCSTLHSDKANIDALQSLLIQACDGGAKDADNANNHVTFLQQSRRSNSEISEFSQAIQTNDIHSIRTIFASMNDLQNRQGEFDRAAVMIDQSCYVNNFELSEAFYASVATHYKRVFGCDTVKDALQELLRYRCLSATNTGPFGTHALNNEIENTMSKSHSHIVKGGVYRGLPIMVVQNDYRLNIFNGDVGIIWPDDNAVLKAWFAVTSPKEGIKNDLRSISLSALPNYHRVYAMTIHKTQGSEFDNVDIVLANKDKAYLSRELLYTAVTRARTSVRLISNQDLFLSACAHSDYRASGLIEKLHPNTQC